MIKYINFLEKLAGKKDDKRINELLNSHKESIMNTLHGVPLLLRNLSSNLQGMFDIKFPRKIIPQSDKPYFKTSLDAKTLALLHTGSPAKRFRPGAIIESGTLYMDLQLKHLVFQKNNSLSLQSRDIIYLGDMIKIVKGYDERSAFIEAIKKYNICSHISPSHWSGYHFDGTFVQD